jgi:hypothetical protein
MANPHLEPHITRSLVTFALRPLLRPLFIRLGATATLILFLLATSFFSPPSFISFFARRTFSFAFSQAWLIVFF